MAKLFLFDIEGTTTDISFVHNVLFPYSKARMEEFITSHEDQSEVADALALVKQTVLAEEHKTLESVNELSNKLLHWIETDRKHPALKALQGLIWDHGYKSGDFQGHVYEDVAPFFKKLKGLGHTIGIYSSGSVHAQKLIFGYSTAGDLTDLISFYFDTKVGAKREASSYENIIKAVGLEANEITFFSDIPQELAAAQVTGIKPVHLVRPGTAASEFMGINNFNQFEI